MAAIVCLTCKTATVVEVGEDPVGVKYFVCFNCDESKRWCPRCTQGWVYKWVNSKTDEILFNCEECEATWQSVDKVGSEDTSQFSRPFNGSMDSFEQVKTYEKT